MMNPLLLAAMLSTEEGRWLLYGLGVLSFVLTLTLVVTGVMVNLRKLKHPQTDTTKTFVSNVPLEVRGVVEYVTKPEFQEFSDYVHKRNHKLDEALNAIGLQSEERRLNADENFKEIRREIAAVSEKLDMKRSNTAKDLYEQLKAAELKLQEVKADAATHTRQLDNIATKLDRILTTRG